MYSLQRSELLSRLWRSIEQEQRRMKSPSKRFISKSCGEIMISRVYRDIRTFYGPAKVINKEIQVEV